MANYTLQPNEQIVRETSHVMWFKSRLQAHAGTLVLSNQRLFFVQGANPMAGPLLKLFMKSQREKISVNLPLADLVAVEKSSFGLNKDVFLLNTKDGGAYRFSHQATEWIATLTPLLKKA